MADDMTKPAQELAGQAHEAGQRMREMAGSGLAQARKSYEEYSTGTERAVNAMESAFRQAWLGARDMNQRMMSFADQNAKLGFDYAEKMASAGSPTEAMTLQQEFFRVQAEKIGQQMRELNELAAKATREAQDAVKARS